jgi:hypothetical protein
MTQSVNAFVGSTDQDGKNMNSDMSSHDNNGSQLSRILQPTLATSGSKAHDPILLDGDEDSNPTPSADREPSESSDANMKNRPRQQQQQPVVPDVNKSTIESEMPERRRDSSIKKILSNQPLEKQEYAEINQKVQNSTVDASKVHASGDPNSMERTNSAGAREHARSRGSITMRMLMGANGIYADGKAAPMTPSEMAN